MNAINGHCCAEYETCKEALYLSPFETHLNCTSGDVFRNSFIKKEDETEYEEQSTMIMEMIMIMVNRTRKKVTSWVIDI